MPAAGAFTHKEEGTTVSNPESIAQHHAKWDALPPFPQWPYVMTDDDVEFWGDVLYLRGLADAIHTSPVRPTLKTRDAHGSVEYDTEQYLEPWPPDNAATMLAAWQLMTHTPLGSLTMTVQA